MICLIRAGGTGPVWAHFQRLSDARFHGNLVIAVVLALLLRDLW